MTNMTNDINMITTKDISMTTMVTKTNIDNHRMNQIHIQVAITWVMVMTVTAIVMIHMVHNNNHLMTKNQAMITAVKALMVIIVTTKLKIKNMNVKQVHSKASL